MISQEHCPSTKTLMLPFVNKHFLSKKKFHCLINHFVHMTDGQGNWKASFNSSPYFIPQLVLCYMVNIMNKGAMMYAVLLWKLCSWFLTDIKLINYCQCTVEWRYPLQLIIVRKINSTGKYNPMQFSKPEQLHARIEDTRQETRCSHGLSHCAEVLAKFVCKYCKQTAVELLSLHYSND